MNIIETNNVALEIQNPVEIINRSSTVTEKIKKGLKKIGLVVLKVFWEIAKIVAVALFLEVLSAKLINRNKPFSLGKNETSVRVATVIAPVFEEIVFRGIVLKSMHGIQKGWNVIRRKELTEIDIQTQKIWRINLCAFLFSFIHLTNSHENKAGTMTQVFGSHVGGIAYAGLAEKYHSLAPSILCHGLNNIITVAITHVSTKYVPLLMLAFLANKIGAMVLAYTDLDTRVLNSCKRAGHFCLATSGRLVHHFRPQRPAELEAMAV